MHHQLLPLLYQQLHEDGMDFDHLKVNQVTDEIYEVRAHSGAPCRVYVWVQLGSEQMFGSCTEEEYKEV